MSYPSSIPDFDRLHPPNGSKVEVRVHEWRLQADNPFVIFVDGSNLYYDSWIKDDNRWQTRWRNHIGKPNIGALIRVGREEGPFGMKCWPIDVYSLDKAPSDPAPVEPDSALIQPSLQLKSSAIVNVKDPETELDFSSLQVRFETDQAAWLRAVAKKNGVDACIIARKCIAQSMAWYGEGISE